MVSWRAVREAPLFLRNKVCSALVLIDHDLLISGMHPGDAAAAFINDTIFRHHEHQKYSKSRFWLILTLSSYQLDRCLLGCFMATPFWNQGIALDWIRPPMPLRSLRGLLRQCTIKEIRPSTYRFLPFCPSPRPLSPSCLTPFFLLSILLWTISGSPSSTNQSVTQ